MEDLTAGVGFGFDQLLWEPNLIRQLAAQHFDDCQNKHALLDQCLDCCRRAIAANAPVQHYPPHPQPRTEEEDEVDGSSSNTYAQILRTSPPQCRQPVYTAAPMRATQASRHGIGCSESAQMSALIDFPISAGPSGFAPIWANQRPAMPGSRSQQAQRAHQYSGMLTQAYRQPSSRRMIRDRRNASDVYGYQQPQAIRPDRSDLHIPRCTNLSRATMPSIYEENNSSPIAGASNFDPGEIYDLIDQSRATNDELPYAINQYDQSYASNVQSWQAPPVRSASSQRSSRRKGDALRDPSLRYHCHHLNCGCTFNDSQALRRHEVRVHAPKDQRSHRCTIHFDCGLTFDFPKDLERHEKTHREVNARRDFVCPHPSCDKDYTRRDNLRRHLRDHHKLQSVDSGLGPSNSSSMSRQTSESSFYSSNQPYTPF